MSRYGKYHVFANAAGSEAFDVNTQADLTPIVKRLEFKTRRPIAYDGPKIGQAIQRPRQLSWIDEATMQAYATEVRRRR